MAVTSRVTLPSPLLRCDMIFSTHREATSPWRSGRKEQRNSPGPADFKLATDEQRRMARHHGAKPQPARRCEAVEAEFSEGLFDDFVDGKIACGEPKPRTGARVRRAAVKRAKNFTACCNWKAPTGPVLPG